MSTKPELSPVGDSTRDRAGRRSRESMEYRAEQQLAERMGTSHSAVSRMRSGQHPTKPETLRRLAAALEMRLVIGFESGPKELPTRELITL